MNYDLAIIGLGPAGLEALDVALKNNLRVIVFEKNYLGGTCLNNGCIPTKTILHSANLLNEVKNSSNFGIEVENIKFNWNKIIDRKNNIVQKFNKSLNQILSKNVEIINNVAEIIIDNDKLLINSKNNLYQATNIIVATGSESIELPNLKFNHKTILNSDDILSLGKLPKSITIVGSGAIGLEIAQFLNSFDVEVTIVEKAPCIAPNLDVELQKRIERNLKVNKIKYYINNYIVDYYDSKVKLASGIEFSSENILVAVGRKVVLPNIFFSQNLKKTELNLNSDCTCNIDNIYFIGDCTKQTMLAHSGKYQARQIMNKILGKEKLENINIPSVIYMTPEIASVGIKEQDIKNDDEYIIKKILVSSIAKSWCEEAYDGVVKIIIKNKLIVGAHIVSKNASMLISIFNILINKEIPITEIEDMIFPHPCFSELIQEVVKNGK